MGSVIRRAGGGLCLEAYEGGAPAAGAPPEASGLCPRTRRKDGDLKRDAGPTNCQSCYGQSNGLNRAGGGG